MNTSSMYSPHISSILRTVLERCHKENEQNRLQVPFEQVEDRVTYYTGFNKASVLQISQFHKDQSKIYQRYPCFDVPERILITKALEKFYSERDHPKFYSIYENLIHSLKVDFFQFKNEMLNLGFNYTPGLGGLILTEDPKRKFERYHYVNKIRKFREDNSEIVYVDVKIITDSNTYEEFDKYVEGEILINKYIFLHVVSNGRLINYLFCNKISSNIIKKWIFETVLQSLKPGTVLVLNNHSLFGEMVSKNITRYHSKKDMFNWLQNNNIPCNDNMHKADLYDLIEKCSRKDKVYVIDKIIQTNGHEVLHIPYKCKKLSLTVLMWNEMTYKTVLQEKSQPLYIRNKLIKNIENVLKTKSIQFFETITNWENTIFNIDVMIENHLDTYSFDVQKIKAEYFS